MIHNIYSQDLEHMAELTPAVFHVLEEENRLENLEALSTEDITAWKLKLDAEPTKA